jgi:PhnB protein
MKEIVTYLNFEDQTRAAMTFYAKCLDGELFTMPFGEVPGGCAPEAKDRTMHACITKGGRPVLMASDTPPGMQIQPGNNFHVSIHCDSVEEIERLFGAFGDGGTVVMPLGDMFWGARFGMLKDRFGVQWMFNYELPKSA